MADGDYGYTGPDDPPEWDGEIRNYLLRNERGEWSRISPNDSLRYGVEHVERETGRGRPRTNTFLKPKE